MLYDDDSKQIIMDSLSDLYVLPIVFGIIGIVIMSAGIWGNRLLRIQSRIDLRLQRNYDFRQIVVKCFCGIAFILLSIFSKNIEYDPSMNMDM